MNQFLLQWNKMRYLEYRLAGSGWLRLAQAGSGWLDKELLKALLGHGYGIIFSLVDHKDNCNLQQEFWTLLHK